MNRIPKSLPTLALSLLVLTAGCSSESSGGSDPGSTSRPASGASAEKSGPAAAPVAIEGVHDVKCGCCISGIDACGNYIDVDGEWLTLSHPALGVMEFCKQQQAGAKIEVVGEVQGDKVVAESWKLVQ